MTTNKYSAHKIVNHPAKLQSFREGKIVAPLYVRIKPTNRCNHACSWCVYQSSFSGMHELAGNKDGWKKMKPQDIDEIPTPKLLEIIQDLGDMGVKAVTFSGGGEPLLHPGICEAMRFCLKLGINYSIITNGQMINGDRANLLASAAWVRVSIDYANPEQMRQSRGTGEAAYNMVMDNLTKFSKIKLPDCELSINWIVTLENHRSLFESALKLKECGVNNIRFSPVWRPDFQTYHAPLIGVVEKQMQTLRLMQTDEFKVYSSYNLTDPQHGGDRKHHQCWFLQITPSIGADCSIYACHQKSYSADGMLGSIKSRSFKEAWFSDDVKQRMQSLDPMKSCRSACAAHHKNDLIANILDAGDDHFV